MTTKEQFIEMAKGITRPGIDQMMAWLERCKAVYPDSHAESRVYPERPS